MVCAGGKDVEVVSTNRYCSAWMLILHAWSSVPAMIPQETPMEEDTQTQDDSQFATNIQGNSLKRKIVAKMHTDYEASKRAKVSVAAGMGFKYF